MRKSILTFLVMFVLLSFCVTVPECKAQAAATGSLVNVLKAPVAPAGSWHKTADGKRYRLDSNGAFVAKQWYKIGKRFYYFTSAGYVKKGMFTYNNRTYYFDKYGRLVRGWRKISGQKYYFWKSAARGALAGSAAVGKVTIYGKEYYFNTAGQMQTGWKKIGDDYYYFDKTTGVMAKNTTIGKYKVDDKGRRITEPSGTTPPAATGQVDIWVGDSRTVGLGYAVGISGKCIAQVGEGYYWYCNYAESQLKSRLNANPKATVVFNLGVNDIDNYSLYIAKYQALQRQYPKARFFYMAINPVDFKKYSSPWLKDSSIKTFNAKLKAAFPSQYLDTYTLIRPYVTSGYANYSSANTDGAGLHYSNTIYKKIYDFVRANV